MMILLLLLLRLVLGLKWHKKEKDKENKRLVRKKAVKFKEREKDKANKVCGVRCVGICIDMSTAISTGIAITAVKSENEQVTGDSFQVL